MTIEQVIQGIVDAIFAAFNSAVIYTESIEQGLVTPAFLVKCLNPSQEVDLGIRYSKSLQFAIQYFPAEESYAECNEVCDMLFDALEDITVNGHILHGSNMSGETNDHVLTFTVDYRLFQMKVIDKTMMQELEITQNIRKD